MDNAISNHKECCNKMCICIVILQNISIFFPYLFHAITLIQLLCLLLYITYFLLHRSAIVLNKNLIYWYLYVAVVFFNYYFGGDLNYIISFCIFNLVMLFSMNIEGISVMHYSIIKLCCFIHLIGNVMIFIMPAKIVNTILSVLLNNYYQSNYSWRVIRGLNPGISSDIGTNAMFLSICIMVCVVELLESNKKKGSNLLILILSFIMLLTTSKRGALIFTLLSIILYYFFIHYSFSLKLSLAKLSKIMFIISVVCFFVYMIITKSSFGETIVKKTSDLLQSGDITNGRLDLFNLAIKYFKTSPIVGVGFKTIYFHTGLDVHNTYMQILAEVGILGFIVFIFGICPLMYTSKKRLKLIICEKRRVNNIYVLQLPVCNIALGFMLLLFLLQYGVIGNTFIDYLPCMLFCTSITLIHGK